MEHRSDAPGPKGRIPSASNSQSRILQLLIATILLSSVSPLLSNAGGEGAAQESESAWEVKVIEPEVVSIVPHDPTAFTQGLEIHDGKFYESTGLYGESSVRIVNMTTGEIELQRDLPDQFFGEGLTIWNDSVIQLTWREKIGFIYDINTLELIGNFSYDGEGWGICESPFEGLWISDGSSELYRLSDDLSTVEEEVEIRMNEHVLDRWNELECGSHLIANRWYDDSIYSISSTGRVCQMADLSFLREQYETEESGVLNGIARDDHHSDTLWVTGKNWSNYYGIRIEFEMLDENCERFEPSQAVNSPYADFYSTLLSQFIGSAVLIIVLSTAVAYYSIISKRQTEKPPRLGSKEE
jgi:glutaminyl-peptide cyclotransferase